MKKILNEFKEFINKGNAFDLAIGIIIGACFTNIINSIVNGIFKPLIELIPGNNGISLLKIVLKEGTTTQDPIILDIGSVISSIITFIITALVLFILVKIFNKAKEESKKVVGKIKEKEINK